MMAAILSPVSSNSAGAPLVPQRRERRQQCQRFLEWDRDEAGETRSPTISRAAASTEPTSREPSPFDRVPAAGPRRMGDVMPGVLARYGLKL
jgi:hypothetical protein